MVLLLRVSRHSSFAAVRHFEECGFGHAVAYLVAGYNYSTAGAGTVVVGVAGLVEEVKAKAEAVNICSAALESSAYFVHTA